MKCVNFLVFLWCDALTNKLIRPKSCKYSKVYKCHILRSIAPLRQEGLCFQCFGVEGNAKLCLVTQVCRVDVSPTDVSLTESSWMLRPLNKASLEYCVPDWCVPTLDRVRHGPHNAWVSRPGSWVKIGALRAPSLTTTSLLAGLNAWTASRIQY